MKDKQYMLVIMDGVGLNENEMGNAVKLANTPNLDKLMAKYPNATLDASGEAVGLPQGQMGNSEVGHMSIGAGRVIYQDLMVITKKIESGEFFKNPALLEAIENVKRNNSKLHILGLVSDGGVHSVMEHLYATIELAKREGLENNVYIHAFMDGRDTPPTSGIEYIRALENKCKELSLGKIATITGRYYAMDRDKNWDRIEKAYNALTLGEGVKYKSAERAIENSYECQVFDEFINPIIITDDEGKPLAKIENNDSVIFVNSRTDRGRELSHALTDNAFEGFVRQSKLKLKYITCQLVSVVSDVGCEVGVEAVAAAQNVVLQLQLVDLLLSLACSQQVLAEDLGSLEPQSAFLLIEEALLAQHVDSLFDIALVQLALEEPCVVNDAVALEVSLHLGDVAAEAELCQCVEALVLAGILQAVAVFCDVVTSQDLDVLAVVAVFGELESILAEDLLHEAGFDGVCELVDLVAGVVDIELTGHFGAAVSQHGSQSVTQNAAAGVAHVHGAGGVGRNELDHDLHGVLQSGAAVLVALCLDGRQNLLEPTVAQTQVDKAGSSSFHGAEDGAGQVSVLADRLCGLEGSYTQNACILHGEGRSVVAVLKILGSLDNGGIDLGLGQNALLGCGLIAL